TRKASSPEPTKAQAHQHHKSLNQFNELISKMDLLNIFVGANILTAWLICLLLNYTWPRRSYKEEIWWALGVVGFVFLLVLLFEYGLALDAGYLLEQFGFYRRVSQLVMPFMIFEVLVASVIALNVFQKFREKIEYRKAQLALITLYLVGYFSILGYRPYAYATSVIPGWHTTIYEIGTFLGVLTWLAIIVVLVSVRGAFSAEYSKS
ncbi:MAG: hypothetical protein AAFZ63_24860, partial [Bacteroidota bacterium]